MKLKIIKKGKSEFPQNILKKNINIINGIPLSELKEFNCPFYSRITFDCKKTFDICPNCNIVLIQGIDW